MIAMQVVQKMHEMRFTKMELPRLAMCNEAPILTGSVFSVAVQGTVGK
jgi:hypothetical protein